MVTSSGREYLVGIWLWCEGSSIPPVRAVVLFSQQTVPLPMNLRAANLQRGWTRVGDKKETFSRKICRKIINCQQNEARPSCLWQPLPNLRVSLTVWVSLPLNAHRTLRCHKVKTGDTADGRETYFCETILLSACPLAFTISLAVSLQKRDTLVSGSPPGNTG